MKQMMPDWVRNQMLDGLSKLMVLRLQGAPPADTITAVAEVWCEALTPYTWAFTPEHDAERLPTAFRRLIQQADRWQQPAQLIQLIPMRPTQPIAGLLERKSSPPGPEQRAKAAEIKKQIMACLDKMAERSLKPPPPRKPEDLLYEWSLIYDPKTGQKRPQPLPDKRKKS